MFSFIAEKHFDDFDAAKVDVILRPDPAEARRTTDVTSIWAGEIVFHEVPVHWGDYSSRMLERRKFTGYFEFPGEENGSN